MATYPQDDEFEEHKIESVRRQEGGGWDIGFDGALGFGVPADSPVEPTVGMTVRLYGRGLGSPVRGLFLNGVKVYYRTEAEDKEHREIEMYGADCEALLAKWDRGGPVHTIEMGGLGPGYEQCIHITAFEILRHLVATKPDHSLWQDRDVWRAARDEIDAVVMKVPAVKALGLSGAQWGAAMNLATMFYIHGPRGVMNDARVKDRHIMVSKAFPQAA